MIVEAVQPHTFILQPRVIKSTSRAEQGKSNSALRAPSVRGGRPALGGYPRHAAELRVDGAAYCEAAPEAGDERIHIAWSREVDSG